MKTSEHYTSDVLFFFDGKPLELALYETLFRHLDAEFQRPEVIKARCVLLICSLYERQ